MTDIRGFSGRGDSFPEHKRHVSMVLMIVLKYLGGQFFFLRRKYRAVNTFAHHERYEVKRLMGGEDCSARYETGPRRPSV